MNTYLKDDDDAEEDEGDDKDMNTKQGGKQLVSKDDVFKAYKKVRVLSVFICVFARARACFRFCL